jgi:heme-degrading monooxygenase HmoA
VKINAIRVTTWASQADFEAWRHGPAKEAPWFRAGPPTMDGGT